MRFMLRRETVLSALLMITGWITTLSAQSKDPSLPSLPTVLATVSQAGIKETIEEIPATVVDTGILKFVPYASHRIGPNRELNIYGDPEKPTCVEIGLYRELLNSPEEKARCIQLLQRLVPDIKITGLSLNGDKMLKNGVVAEVTTPDSPDAYGGWWVSVYSLSRLRGESGERSTVSEVIVDRAAAPEVLQAAGWTSDQFTYARPPSGTSSGHRVYVKGYTRKNGTYVRPHSRRE
ncbi:MAG: hypothetical protein QM760_20345 [Nibricoccus sp.]